MTFTLDTSGVVACFPTLRSSWQGAEHLSWSDLSPFAQGALTAATEELQRQLDAQKHGLWMRVGFANWSPEALAMILGDCERFAEVYGEGHPQSHAKYFFLSRQEGRLSQFPPLTVSLGDDGKVRLAVAS